MKTFAVKVIFMKALSIRQPENKMYFNNWSLKTYLLVENKICSLLYEASPQSKGQSDGN